MAVRISQSIGQNNSKTNVSAHVAGITPCEFSFLKGLKSSAQVQIDELRNSLDSLVVEINSSRAILEKQDNDLQKSVEDIFNFISEYKKKESRTKWQKFKDFFKR